MEQIRKVGRGNKRRVGASCWFWCWLPEKRTTCRLVVHALLLFVFCRRTWKSQDCCCNYLEDEKHVTLQNGRFTRTLLCWSLEPGVWTSTSLLSLVTIVGIASELNKGQHNNWQGDPNLPSSPYGFNHFCMRAHWQWRNICHQTWICYVDNYKECNPTVIMRLTQWEKPQSLDGSEHL